MHEALRRRILRRLETLPETRLYQVLDYIEFMESRYGERAPADVSTLQSLAERLEDGLRRRTLSPSNLREAFQVLSAADRALHAIAEAGRNLLTEAPTPPAEGSGSTAGSGSPGGTGSTGSPAGIGYPESSGTAAPGRSAGPDAADRGREAGPRVPGTRPPSSREVRNPGPSGTPGGDSGGGPAGRAAPPGPHGEEPG